MSRTTQTAVFGGGCFWCTEAIFIILKGVRSVTPGYAGGATPNPTYEQVCSGTTGHAEVIKIEFDPSVISYHDLLEVFFTLHDPTTRNQQGNDFGEQYRSIVLYTNDEQQRLAERFIQRLGAEKIYPHPVVTEVRPLAAWYPAEGDHRDYFTKNAQQPYCQLVIAPKLTTLRKKFSARLKTTRTP